MAKVTDPLEEVAISEVKTLKREHQTRQHRRLVDIGIVLVVVIFGAAKALTFDHQDRITEAIEFVWNILPIILASNLLHRILKKQ
jgi:hypothetical protein